MARSTRGCHATRWRITLTPSRCSGKRCCQLHPLLDLLELAPLLPYLALELVDLVPDFGDIRIPLPAPELLARFLGDLAVALADAVELLLLELLEVEQHVVPALGKADQLGELDPDRLDLPVPRVQT